MKNASYPSYVEMLAPFELTPTIAEESEEKAVCPNCDDAYVGPGVLYCNVSYKHSSVDCFGQLQPFFILIYINHISQQSQKRLNVTINPR